MINQIKKAAAELVEHYAFHGVILVGKKENVLFQRAYGLAQREWLVPHVKESIFNVCSITKIITAVAILQNFERGILRLDAPLSEFLPDYPFGTSITVHHLLSHSSGLPEICATSAFMRDKNNPTTPFESILPILKQPLDFEPDSKHAYSSTNYLLLTGILEKITGVTYHEYLKHNIFNPLGMDSTSYLDTKKIILHRARGYCHQEPFGVINAPYFDDSWPQGAGGLSSTAYDLFLLYDQKTPCFNMEMNGHHYSLTVIKIKVTLSLLKKPTVGHTESNTCRETVRPGEHELVTTTVKVPAGS